MPQSCGYFWIWGENVVLQERYTHPALHMPEQDGAPSFTHIMGMGNYWYFPNCHLSQSSWLGWIFGKWPSVKKSHHFQLCKQDACNYLFFFNFFFKALCVLGYSGRNGHTVLQDKPERGWHSPETLPLPMSLSPPSPQPLVNYDVKEFIPHLNIHAVYTQSQASAEVYKGSISQNLIHYIYRWRLGQQCSFPQHRWWWWSR